MRDQRPPFRQLMPIREGRGQDFSFTRLHSDDPRPPACRRMHKERGDAGEAFEFSQTTREDTVSARDGTNEERRSGGRPGHGDRRPPPGPAASRWVARESHRLAAGLLLAVAGLLGLSADAQAQTTYVDNLGQTKSSINSTGRLAQRFTTGSETAGYALGSVDISMGTFDSGETLAATIYETNNSGIPTTTVVHALTAPSTFPSNSVLTFNAPANATLDPSTTYAVVFEPTGTIGFQRTASNTEDEAETGWSIADAYTFHNGTNWVHHTSQSLLIAVKGPAATTTVPGAPTGLMATAPRTRAINLEWTAPTNDGGSAITGYRIEVSSDGGSTWADLEANTGRTGTRYAHTGISPSTTRHYRVSAINANGTGNPSGTASATTRDAIILVSNFGETQSGAGRVGTDGALQLSRTQQFVTGDSDGGYALTDVTVRVASVTTTDAPRVSIYTDSSNEPETLLYTLTNPARFANGEMTFTAPADATLESSTNYHVVVEATAGAYRVGYTDSSQGGGASNWRIGIDHQARDSDAGSWTVQNEQWLRISIGGVVTQAAPGAPTGLMATASGTGTINLEWTAPTNNGGSEITGYRIEVSSDGGSTWTDLVANTASTATTYAHTGLTGGTTRHYRVSAINVNGTGTASGTASATTDEEREPGTTLVSNTGQTSAGTIHLRTINYAQGFTAGTDPEFSSVELYRHSGSLGTGTLTVTLRSSTSGGNPSTVLATLTNPDSLVAGLNTFTDPDSTQLTSGATYFIGLHYDQTSGGPLFHVTTDDEEDSGGVAGWTIGDSRHQIVKGSVNWTTDTSALMIKVNGKLTAPGAPTGLMATASGQSAINLEWTAPTSDGGSAITGYRIEVSADAGSTWTDLVATTGDTATTYAHTGLAGGTTRHYRVSAINAIGTGDASGTASATTDAAPIRLVSNLGQSSDGTFSTPDPFAQRFTTGSQAAGSRLASVDISMGTINAGVTLAAAIHETDVDGFPTTTVVHALTAPSTFTSNSVLTFTAPADATLDPSTTYIVVFTPMDSIRFQRASSNIEDEAETGWSIANVYTSRSGVTWSDHHVNSLLIAVNGTIIPPTPVTIAANHDTIGAGLEDLVFTLERGGETTDELAATVAIAQNQTWLTELSHDVTFAAGSDTTSLTLPWSDFSFTPSTTDTLIATVSGSGLSGGADTVVVVSTADPPITIGYDMLEYTFAENDTDPAVVYVEATLDAAYPRPPTYRLVLSFSTRSGTAESPEDYPAISLQTSSELEGYERASDTDPWVARHVLRDPDLGIVDDEVYEGTEQFGLIIEQAPGLVAGVARFLEPDGTYCQPSVSCPSPPSQFPVYITDEEDRPALTLSADKSSIEEEDDTSTPDIAEHVSTVTVEITNGKTFARDTTVTLTFSGDAVQGTDYGVSPADADSGSDGHQVVLPAGGSTLTVAVTAVADTTTDGHRTVDVAGDLGGTAIGTASITIRDDETTANAAPVVANAIPDQNATVGTVFSYAFPANTFSDADGDDLTYAAKRSDDSALPSWLSFTPATRTFSGTPASAGTVSVKVTASDGNGGSVDDVFDIVVAAANTAPVVDNRIPDQNATVGTAFSYAFPANTFSDADNDALSYQATRSDDSALPSWLGFTAATRNFSGTPTAAGTVSVKVTASDGRGGSVDDVFDIVVAASATNRAPTFDDGASTTRTVAEDAGAGDAIGAEVGATDPDGDQLTYALEGTDAGLFTIVENTGQLRARGGVLNYEEATSHEVTVTVSDGTLGDEIDVTVNVTDVDEPPGRPNRPTVSSFGATRLSVRWSAPSNSGPRIDDYDLRYRAVGANSWTDGPQNLETTNATLDNLAEGTTYEVQVRASNAEGTGEWSESGRGTPSPLSLTVEMLADTVTEGEPVRYRIKMSSRTGWITVGKWFSYRGDFMKAQPRSKLTDVRTRGNTLHWDFESATVDDGTEENDGSFTVTLSSGDGYTLGSPSSATVRILDNDDGSNPVGAAVSVADTSTTEDKDLVFTVRLDRALATTATVDWGTLDGGGSKGAKAGRDYVGGKGTVTFSPGQTVKRVPITVTDDALVEPNETMLLLLSNPVGATMDNDGSVAKGVIYDNDASPMPVAGAGAALDAALAVAHGLTPAEAAGVLLGEARPGEALLSALDLLGNGNGRYDLGDLLAWIDRCRRGGARCGTPSRTPPPASDAALPGAVGAGSVPKRPRRRRSGERRLIRRRTGIFAALLAATLWSCDGAGGPTAPQAQAPEPGYLAVEWTAPAGGVAVAGALVEIHGPGIGDVHAPGLELYGTGEGPGPRRFVLAGNLGNSPVLEFRVPDRQQAGLYGVRVVEVAGDDHRLLEPGDYRAVVRRR